jgi:hypothetical protein
VTALARQIAILAGVVEMANGSDDIANLVFQRTLTALNGQVVVNGRMLDLLILIDGRTTIREVSQKMKLGMTEMRTLLSKLIANGLVAEVERDLDPQFLGFLVGRLSRVAGPIARMMVEDAVMEIGKGVFRVPMNRGKELVEMLGNQIPNSKQKAAFIREMNKRLSEL